MTAGNSKQKTGLSLTAGTNPLREDVAFIESAAEVLGWNYHHKPYTKVDERSDEF